MTDRLTAPPPATAADEAANAAADAARTQVIYIAGSGRSGSTLLDRVLGAVDGAATFNELYNLLDDVYVEARLCSCRRAPADCPVWSPILADLGARYDLDKVRRDAKRFERSQFLPKLLTGRMGAREREDLDQYLRFVADLMAQLRSRTGARVLIDSSKIPTRALLLAKTGTIDVHVVHLVRDPRAFMAAWRKTKADPSISGEMPRYPLHKTTFVWFYRQIGAELLRLKLPYTRVRYEDFTAAPAATIARLTAEIPALAGAAAPFDGERRINLPPVHSMRGNPDRFEHGWTEIHEDRGWTSNPEAAAFRRWALLLAPLTARYGYRGAAAPEARP